MTDQGQERDAIARMQQGDVDGMEILVRLYARRALRAACLVTHDYGLAEDAVQEAFIRVYVRIDRFDATRPFGPWFFRVLTRTAIDAANRQDRGGYSSLQSATEFADSLPTREIGPEAASEGAELRALVWDALAQLPPKQRAAIVMRYYLDLPEDDMARELAVAPGTVKSRLHAARCLLRGMLLTSLMEEVRR